jgi:hypothetical protein
MTMIAPIGAESRTPEVNRYDVIDDKAHAGPAKPILDIVEPVRRAGPSA